MGMWNDIGGQPKRIAGAAGTVTLANGGKLLRIWAHATSASTVAWPDGKGGTVTVPIPANTVFWYEPMHLGCVLQAGQTVVFTSTDSFFVEWME